MVCRESIEKRLQLIRKGITDQTCGTKFAAVEVRFPTEELARRHSTSPLKSVELVLLPTYLRRCTSKVKVREIPVKISVIWLTEAIILNLEDKISIHQQNW